MARAPWWLWPNLLALDAPAVALVWQEFLADRHGVAVPMAARFALGLAVWGVYLLDRALDARAGRRDTARHRFAARFARAVLALGIGSFLAAGIFALFLPAALIRSGTCLAAVTGGYLAVAHRRKPSAESKCATVGLVFAAGVALATAETSLHATVWVGDVAAFAGLCWLNCLVIARAEDGPGAPSDDSLVLSLLPILLSPLLLPVATLLLWLDASRRPSPDARRVLADVALLAPLLLMLL